MDYSIKVFERIGFVYLYRSFKHNGRMKINLQVHQICNQRYSKRE